MNLQSLIDALGERVRVPFSLTMPGGHGYRSGVGSPLFHIILRSEATLASCVMHGHIGLLDAYFNQDVDIEGDLGAALAAGMAGGLDRLPSAIGQVENELHELRFSNRRKHHAKSNARAHYGLGTEFFRLWLDDPLMMYTCGYWPQGTLTLEDAQRQKIDHVCRKLRLSAGERFVDIGCGFGGFMFRAHETTGAKGVGINTTTEQVDWLQAEIATRGLAQELEVREADFRDVEGLYDKVVSIGVLEHAGRDQLTEVIRAHANCLKPGGLGMLHFIGHVGRFETDLFIRKYVFPGGWIPSLADVIVDMERQGLEVIDVENLRRHYAPTLDAWAERFDRRWAQIQALNPELFNERFRRIWRVYLIGCAEMFRSPTGYTHLFQIVFSKGNINGSNYPMSRAHLYE